MKYLQTIILCTIFSISYGQNKLDTVKSKIIFSDNKNVLKVIDGYAVREQHSEDEGSIDWYFDHRRPPGIYYRILFYLNYNKIPLSKKFIIWQSKEL